MFPKPLALFPKGSLGQKGKMILFFFFLRDWSIILNLPRISEVWPNFCIDALAISFFRQLTQSVNAQGLQSSFFSFFKGWAPEAHRGRACEDHAARLWPGPFSPNPQSSVLTYTLTQWLKTSLLKVMHILKTTWELLVVQYSKCWTQGIFIASHCHITRPFALWDLSNRDK